MREKKNKREERDGAGEVRCVRRRRREEEEEEEAPLLTRELVIPRCCGAAARRCGAVWRGRISSAPLSYL